MSTFGLPVVQESINGLLSKLSVQAVTLQAADPVLDQLDIAAAAKSPSGGAVGFRRPPISPSRGSGKRLLDAANPPQDAASTSSPPSTPTRQSQPEPSPFPERFDGSLPCSARLAAAVGARRLSLAAHRWV